MSTQDQRQPNDWNYVMDSALARRTRFKAYTKAGFTEEQALRLCVLDELYGKEPESTKSS